MATYIAAGTIIFIAMLHSILGEVEILSPLFRAEWETSLPRYAVERILRFAWHLTSIAWIALGVAALGGGALDALGACALASAAVSFSRDITIMVIFGMRRPGFTPTVIVSL